VVFEVSNSPWGNMVSLIAAIWVTGGIDMSRSCWLFSVVSVSYVPASETIVVVSTMHY